MCMCHFVWVRCSSAECKNEYSPGVAPQLRLRLRCSLLRLLVLFSPHCAAVAVSVGVAAVVVVMNDAAFGRVFCLDGTIYKTQTLAATANGENKNI